MRFKHPEGDTAFLQHFQGDDRHTTMGMDKQREFYAKQLYEYIKSEIENNNFYLRDFNSWKQGQIFMWRSFALATLIDITTAYAILYDVENDGWSAIVRFRCIY